MSHTRMISDKICLFGRARCCSKIWSACCHIMCILYVYVYIYTYVYTYYHAYTYIYPNIYIQDSVGIFFHNVLIENAEFEAAEPMSPQVCTQTHSFSTPHPLSHPPLSPPPSLPLSLPLVPSLCYLSFLKRARAFACSCACFLSPSLLLPRRLAHSRENARPPVAHHSVECVRVYMYMYCVYIYRWIYR